MNAAHDPGSAASPRPELARAPTRLRGLARGALLLLLISAACLVLVPSCSLPKDELRARLLELPKNAAIAERGLESLPLTLQVEGRALQAEALIVRVPADPTDADALARPTLVFVHGTPGSLFTWSELVFGRDGEAGLAGRAPIVLLDIVGHGVTEADLGEASFQGCADWIVAALGALDLRDVVLVGHSYGGEFAWRAALDAPERVGRLVLSDSAGFRRDDDEWLPEEVTMREMTGASLGWLFNSEERVAVALQPHFPEDVTGSDRLREMTWTLDNAVNWGAMIDLARDENGTRQDELSTLTQPTLLLWGADDIAYTLDGWAARFAEEIPEATLVALPDTGHYPAEQRPAEYARELLAWVDG